jgi:3-hydroxyisobutyryl-CoA hydrolase
MFQFFKLKSIKTIARMYSHQNIDANEIVLSKVNHVGCILLNRPKKLNALNLQMVEDLQKRLEECELDNNIRSIIIKGAGESAFCAGGDIKSVRDNCVNGNINGAMKHIRGAYKLCYTINNLTKPYVAFLNGIVMGGGVGISLSGKYRVATEKTLFAMPEAAIGYYADFGGSYLMSRLKDYIGIYLVLTGNRLKGKDVRRVGAATHYTNSSNLSKIENELFKVNELTNELVDSILNKYNEDIIDEFDSSKIKEIFSLDSIEKIYESLENDKTEWSKKQLELLNKMSPSSLKVIIRQMSLGKSMSFRDCLIMEKNLSYNFLGKHDFKEGVKTLLVQKDRNPQWKPAKFKEIDQDNVNSYFKETNSYSLDI